MDECEKQLRDWMEAQNTRYYKTPLEKCYEEISRIVKGVYEKNIVISNGKRDIVVNRNELLTIHQYPKKFHKTLNALFIHSKRFKDQNNQFFMTYEQITTAAKCSVRTAIDHINSLEKQKAIIVIKSPLYFVGDIPYNHPNTYQLTFNWLEDEIENSVPVQVNRLEEYSQIRTDLLLKAFPENECMNLSKILNNALLKKLNSNK